MPYNINDYSPTYGGIINSSGNVVNSGDTINTANEVKVALHEFPQQLFTLQNAASALGNGTPANVEGLVSLRLRITITGTATVTFEASTDDVNFNTILGYNLNGQSVSVVSATNEVQFSVQNFKTFRARISAYTSGTVTVGATGSSAQIAVPQNMGSFANSDAAAASSLTQLVAGSNLVYNGSTWDRQRTASADALAATGLTAAGNLVYNGTNWDRRRNASADALSATGLPSSGLMGYNGTTWDRIRTVGAGDGIGTGLLAQGNYVWDATGLVWNRMRSANSVADATTGTTTPSSAPYGFNGATFDRIRVGKVYKYIEYLNLPTSTNTTIWTPAAGKKYRLMGISIATSATVHLHIRDSGTIFHSVRLQGSTVTFDFGNGYLSALANNVLEVRNDSGTTTNVWITAWGTEE